MTACSASCKPRRAGERGGVALLAVIAAVLVLAVAIGGLAVSVDLHAAHARARLAADAAALAGIAASPLVGGDGDPAAAAEQLATVNGGRVVELDRSGWPLRVTVVTATEPRLALTATLGVEVRARAAAQLRPVDPAGH